LCLGLVWPLARAAMPELTLGQVVPVDDPNPVGRHLQEGVRLCLDEVNAQGGIHGARLRLDSRHRGLDPKDSVQRTRALLAERRAYPVVALVALMGTGPTEALLQARVPAEAGVPVIGVRSGATSLRQGEGTEWLFHTRAGYAAEVARVFEHWRTMGIRRVALYAEDSRFGTELRTLFDGRAPQFRLKVVATATHPLRGTDAAQAVSAFHRGGPEAVMVAATTEAAAEFYRAYRASGGAAHVVAVSTVDGAQVVQRIGAAARGLAIVQVMPDPASPSLGFTRELQALVRRAGPKAPALTHGLAEGCLAVRAVAEGLRRAGPHPDGARLRRALEGVTDLDLGGVRLGFAPGHAYASFVDIAMIDAAGRLRR
jgi:ABC-type branched-subunit amino acid transport system substrate-binding protein